jgi:hypothetical protein
MTPHVAPNSASSALARCQLHVLGRSGTRARAAAEHAPGFVEAG